MSDLAFSSSWQEIHHSLRYARKFGNQYEPIPAFDVPNINKPILTIACESQEAKASWVYGATVTQFADLGSTNRTILTRETLPINKSKLFTFRSEFPYTLEFRIAPWHIEFAVTVWEFIG